MDKISKSVFSHKSWDILCKVRDALKVNVYIVDCRGNIVISPEKRRYGGCILLDPAMGFVLQDDDSSLSVRSQFGGKYFELRNRFNLHCFGLPVYSDDLEIGNVILGPVVINKRLSPERYVSLSKEHGLDASCLISNINDIRVVSNMDVSSMLGLIDAIAANNIALSIVGYDHVFGKADRIGKEVDANFKGFLKGILKFANVECGSIMALDKDGEQLTVKAVEGMDNCIVGQSVRMGNGIAGIAASERETFLIGSKSEDNRIAHLLKRSDIKRSLVLPLLDEDRVCGVLNLHTKRSSDLISANLDSINYFSELFARSA
ncbi:MAG: hypothetical protein A2267_10960 [Omnitrophica WOR_2 bacterium RIFOXYA12_FULL_38_10]|nr:MAG: hypothetical protein A2267_10960 [Omnitrophica WOR_2 bacterium RIFOXYA12_FULL_38_10]